VLRSSGKGTVTTSEPWRPFRRYDHNQQTTIYILTSANTAVEWRAACQVLPGTLIQ